jgi:hypothetical protein
MGEEQGGHTLRVMKVGVKVGWGVGRVVMALACLVVAVGLCMLMPLWFLDLLTLGSMRPPVVVWLHDVLTLQYSITEVWAALPRQWPALWDHIGFGWMVMGVMAVGGAGFGLLLLPFVLLFSQANAKR